ncbi:MAG: response regulator [Polyangiaceae bacterium]|nr:response regulator [Polyangiaceae bacterium]
MPSVTLRQTADTNGSTERSTPVSAPRSVDASSGSSNTPLGLTAQDTASGSASNKAQNARPADDPELLGVLFETIRWLAALIATMFAAFTVYNLTRLDARGVKQVLVVDQVGLAIAAVVFWGTHRRRVPLAWAHPAGFLLAVSVSTDVAYSVYAYGEPTQLQYLIAIAVGAGAMEVSTVWLIAILSTADALALWATLLVCSGATLVDYLMMQVGATGLAIVVFAGRMKGQRKLLDFRRRDEQRARELRAALDRAEREFAEHQVSERQRQLLEEQLRQAQKLEALGTLAGGVAHDINNVIGAITAIASTTLPELPPGTPGRREMQHMLAAARRGTTLTRNLLGFARQDAPKNEPFSLNEVVLEVEALLRRTLPKSIEFGVRCEGPRLSVVGDSGLVTHALMNLCLNSADAIAGHGSIIVQTSVLSLDEAGAREYGVEPGVYAELAVRDDGHGMTPEVLERIFEPFFSTKSTKRRSGLGLSMVYSTVQQHRGGLKVTSQPGQGTLITVVLPAYEQRRDAASPRVRRVPAVNPERRIALFVDDEPLLRRAGKRMLVSLGYEVLLASNGRDALTRFKENRERIGVVVLDVAMPVMSGPECFHELRKVDPEIPILLASGFAKGHDIQSLLACERTRYVRKPYELDDLAAALAELSQVSELPPPSVRRLTLA